METRQIFLRCKKYMNDDMMHNRNLISVKSGMLHHRQHLDSLCERKKHITSREKAIPGAPKWLILGAFWFASDLPAGGNAYRWRIL
jgi:hypothetical protein